MSAADQIGGGPFNNQTNAVLNLTGDSDPFLTGVTLTNAGTIDSGSVGLTYLYATITDTGTIDISSGSGTLDFLEGGSFAGPVEGPGLLELGNGDFTIEPGFSYSGPLEFYTSAELVLNSETVTLNGQVTIDDSHIEGPGTLATTGTVTVINGAVLTDGAVWTNQGTVDVSSGQIGGGPFNNQTNAVLNLTGDSDPLAAGVTLTNAGTIDSGGTGLTYLYATIADTGTIDISSGSGTLDFLEGGSFAGPVEGPGVLELSGGVFTIEPEATFTGTVVGASTTLELAQGSGPGTLDALGTTFLDFGSVTVEPGATWTVEALASVLASTTITGSGGSDLLEMISAGTFSLGDVSQFPVIDLAAGNNTVTVTDTTLSVGVVTIKAGTSGNNTISATGDTSASVGKTLVYYAGTGTDSFTGKYENDSVHVSAAGVSGDTLTGGSGTNTLVLSSAGTFSLGGVSKFATIDLAAGNNTVTVTDTTLLSGLVTIKAGASGNNTISAAGDTAASEGRTLIYYAGTGTDSFTGGFENDSVHVSAAA